MSSGPQPPPPLPFSRRGANSTPPFPAALGRRAPNFGLAPPPAALYPAA